MEPTMEYGAVQGARFNDETAKLIAAEVIELAAAGVSTAEGLVRKAADPKSAMHDLIEWDVTRAAALYQEQQARVIVDHIVIRIHYPDGETRETRAFCAASQSNFIPIPVPQARDEPEDPNARALKIYVPVFQAMGNPDARQEILRDYMRLIAGLERRLRELQEFIGDAALQGLGALETLRDLAEEATV